MVSRVSTLTCIDTVVLASDSSVEVDLCSMLPLRCVAYFNRMENYETRTIRKTDHRADLANATRLLAECDTISAMIYRCTPGALLQGPDLIEEVLREVLPSACAVTPMVAAIEAIQAYGVGSISILSPCPEDLNRQLVELFEHHRIAVDTVLSPQDWSKRISSTIDVAEPEMAAASIAFGDSRGLFVPCNVLAIVDMIGEMEGRTGVPVFTSTQVSVWKALKDLGQLGAASLTTFGSIFRHAETARQ